ncbi:hemerythrin domain-containing protein [Bradyrhizobium sp. ISRA443]|uniref:hemerythrin domain-containing protein n=1 Tax=unclassified Bradyrhizobium TaxID=2631580 RepID=UPI00247A65E0|nr:MULTISPECIES: hemerythrin domain-containing protein [unclassified Bradyrhizobium]WGR93169.1 hemerythrin domain-containing protein [Bradyrhizobium sp. ISRA435]WGR97680.1 hemerythrin domain-containing protein [Bradyrhizobium sp. ISRA436]WGS04570.1 hemerythrin domain-containing protein [Bradyrhizobium sp. ISRA437]WGS11451.1 hemerythrin domain-containing protein [Bradyrhizobium sp. ISRA443]
MVEPATPRAREGAVRPAGGSEMKPALHRRALIHAASGLLIASTAGTHAAEADQAAQVTPPEDLLRERGVLNRVLLVYEASLQKLTRGEDFDVGVLSRAATIVHEFIEDYHERNEEQQLFPRFRKAGQMVELVDVLYQQHQAGRRLTDTILVLAPASRAPGESRGRVITSLQSFIAMYRPHEAREDTELFPKLRSIVSPHEFDAMAEDFERDERRKFGEDGFERYVAQVGALEQALGIHDLARMTLT